MVEVFKEQQTANGSFHINHADDRDDVRIRGGAIDEVSMSQD